MYNYNSRYERRPLIERDLDVIYIYRLDKSKVVSDFIIEIEKGLQAGFDNFEIDMSQLSGTFPNAVVPLSGVIKAYEKQGVVFECKTIPPILGKQIF